MCNFSARLPRAAGAGSELAAGKLQAYQSSSDGIPTTGVGVLLELLTLKMSSHSLFSSIVSSIKAEFSALGKTPCETQ